MFPSSERASGPFATVFAPPWDAAGLTESGKPSANVKGLKLLRMQDNTAVRILGSGTCRFQSALPETDKWKTSEESR